MWGLDSSEGFFDFFLIFFDFFLGGLFFLFFQITIGKVVLGISFELRSLCDMGCLTIVPRLEFSTVDFTFII